jgi:ATP-dependent helicase/nuclease subunit A
MLDVSAQQRLASDPSVNVYVSASAGTGKTKVLCDRVLRLMLNGSDIKNILCLTFTNAAASEMSERVLGRLKKWLFMSDEQLHKELQELIGVASSGDLLRTARKLYGKYLSCYQQIKIQTIHSLCNQILRKDPAYRDSVDIIDSSKKQKLIKTALDLVLESRDEEIIAAKKLLAEFYDYNALIGFFHEVLSNKIKFRKALENPVDIYALYGVEKSLSLDAIIDDFTNSIPSAVIHCAKFLVEQGDKLGQQILDSLNPFEFKKYKNCFFTLEGKPRAKLVPVAISRGFPNVLETLEPEVARIQKVEDQKRAIISSQFHDAFLRVMALAFTNYENLKNEERVVEYDDLLIRTIELLKGGESAHILMQLDYVIDHLLVDEAQDLSPLQWELIKLISEEFFSGLGAREENRTIFIVGDYKQSIYSFQGANPDVFLDIKTYFADKVKGALKEWREVDITTSFRSTQPVLEVVDKVFNNPEYRDGLGGVGLIHHAPYRKGDGAVQVWSLAIKDAREEVDGWKIPSLEDEMYDSKKFIAQKIADNIYSWISKGRLLLGHNRVVEPKDILILLKKRSDVLYFLINEIKKKGIAISDADRFKIKDDIIIQDILALLKFIILPQDDLNLACLLKSPFFGVIEDELYQLCHNRESSLWEVIQTKKIELSIQLESYIQLSKKLDLEAFCLAIIEKNKPQFIKRFGSKASSIFNHFMDFVKEYMRSNTPSIQGLVHSLENSNADIQTELSQGENKVRVMTVHASKGLQAPIVILADTASTESVPYTNLYWNDEQFYFSTYTEFDTPYIEIVKQVKKLKEKQESLRLLYVAITRAEDELYVTGWESKKQDDSWYSAISKTVKDEPIQYEYNVKPSNNNVDDTLPEFLKHDFVDKHTYKKSTIATQKAEMKTSEIIRGQLVHELLHILPKIAPENRVSYLDKVDKDISRVVMGVLNKFPELFTNSNLSEVPIMAEISGEKVSVKIDKLIIEDDTIKIIDFKTHSADVTQSEQYKNQLNIYKKVVSKIWPDRSIATYLLWVERLELETIN